MVDETLPEVDIEQNTIDPREQKPVPYLPLNIQGTSLSSQPDNQYPLGVPSFIYQPVSSQATATTDTIPLTQLQKESKGKPGWWKTAAHEFYNYNLELQAGTFALNHMFGENPLADTPPDGWTAMKPESVEGFPRKYWDTLVSAQSPKDLEMRQAKVREQMEQDEYFDSGSWTAKIIGGGAGAIISPSTAYLMPYITTMKYAGIAQSTFMNAVRSAPAVYLDSFARNSFMEANRVGADFESAAVNSLYDTVFGSALIGLSSGIKATGTELNLWNTRKIMKASYDGIGVGHELSADGKTVTGRAKAYPLAGTSVGAKEVEIVQTLVDREMQQSPAYAIPGVKTVVDKLMNIPGTSWLHSPAVSAARSPYKTTKEFFYRIAGNPFITEAELRGEATPDSAQLIADMLSSQSLDFMRLHRDQFLSANGIEGGDTARALKNFQQMATNKRTISMEDFTKEVRSIVEVEGYKSPYSQAHNVADAAMELMQQMNERYAQVTGRELFKDPRTAFKYLPNAYNVDYLKNNRDVFVSTVSNILAKQDQLISDLQRPIVNSMERIKTLTSHIKSMDKNDPLFKNYKNQLASAKTLLERQKETLDEQLKSNPDFEIHLDERNPLTYAERKELKSLLEPIKKAASLVSKQEKELSYLQDRLKESKKDYSDKKESNQLTSSETKANNLSNEITKNVLEIEEKIASSLKEKERLNSNHKKSIEDFNKKISRLNDKRKDAKSNGNKKREESIKSEIEKIKEALSKERLRIKEANDEFKKNNEILYKELKDKKSQLSKDRKALKGNEKVISSINQKRDFLSDEIKDISHEIGLVEKRLEKAKQHHQSVKDEIELKALNGEINSKFYFEEKGETKFHNPSEPLRLRKTYDDDFDRQMTAQAWHETITNSSPQDLVQMVFGGMPQMEGSPSYLKSRKIMIPSNEFTMAGFFEPDIGKTISSYMQSMGRIIGFNHVFPEFANAKDFDGVLKGFHQEHNARIAEIEKEAPSKERDKKMSKLNREKEAAIKHMSDTYKTYMGQYSSHVDKKVIAGAAILKNITAQARLGSIPIYQLADLGGIILKHGLMPFLSAGLKPLLLTANGHIKGKRGEIYREQAAHCGLAVNTEMRNSTMRFVNQFAMADRPVGGLMEKALGATETASHLSSNFFGINSISDLNERLAANVFQSNVMRVAEKYLAGTATKKELADMAHYGISMKEWAQIFTDQSKAAGGFKEGKYAHQSMYHLWENAEAAARMGTSIRRAAEDTILSSSRYASPYWTQHPLYGLVFMFHGWAYNAFNRYTVPLMQRPDAQRMLGFVSIVGLSMMAEPLMRLSNGKEAFEDDATWFDTALKGLDYSGFGGPYWELMANLNKAMGNPFWTGESQKRKQFNGLGAFAGPALGLAYDVAQLGGHGIKGNWTQNDARKLAHLFAVNDHVLTRGLVDNYIKQSGIPESRKFAQNWSWWDALHGEQ